MSINLVLLRIGVVENNPLLKSLEYRGPTNKQTQAYWESGQYSGAVKNNWKASRGLRQASKITVITLDQKAIAKEMKAFDISQIKSIKKQTSLNADEVLEEKKSNAVKKLKGRSKLVEKPSTKICSQKDKSTSEDSVAEAKVRSPKGKADPQHSRTSTEGHSQKGIASSQKSMTESEGSSPNGKADHNASSAGMEVLSQNSKPGSQEKVMDFQVPGENDKGKHKDSVTSSDVLNQSTKSDCHDSVTDSQMPSKIDKAKSLDSVTSLDISNQSTKSDCKVLATEFEVSNILDKAKPQDSVESELPSQNDKAKHQDSVTDSDVLNQSTTSDCQDSVTDSQVPGKNDKAKPQDSVMESELPSQNDKAKHKDSVTDSDVLNKSTSDCQDSVTDSQVADKNDKAKPQESELPSQNVKAKHQDSVTGSDVLNQSTTSDCQDSVKDSQVLGKNDKLKPQESVMESELPSHDDKAKHQDSVTGSDVLNQSTKSECDDSVTDSQMLSKIDKAKSQDSVTSLNISNQSIKSECKDLVTDSQVASKIDNAKPQDSEESELASQDDKAKHQDTVTDSDIVNQSTSSDCQDSITNSQVPSKNDKAKSPLSVMESEVPNQNDKAKLKDSVTVSDVLNHSTTSDCQNSVRGSEVPSQNDKAKHQDSVTSLDVSNQSTKSDCQNLVMDSDVPSQNNESKLQDSVTDTEMTSGYDNSETSVMFNISDQSADVSSSNIDSSMSGALNKSREETKVVTAGKSAESVSAATENEQSLSNVVDKKTKKKNKKKTTKKTKKSTIMEGQSEVADAQKKSSVPDGGIEPKDNDGVTVVGNDDGKSASGGSCPGKESGPMASSSKEGTPVAFHDSHNFESGNSLVEVTKGILHFYKENSKTSLDDDSERSEMLCMLAVPTSMGVHELLQFIASCYESVKSLRIVKDQNPNQYLALINFRSQAEADFFYQHFNGQPFNSIQSDICRLVYVSRVETTEETTAFLPIAGHTELPVCAFCLERMDESVDGILTILCNHSFHSECIIKWTDTSCPVCRYCQVPDEVPEQKCATCGSSEPLWICLICGNIGCGRYAGGHAHTHFMETSHLFALEVGNNRVWDYVRDNYVHRLLQSEGDGKVVSYEQEPNNPSCKRLNAEGEEKLTSIQVEYSVLLEAQIKSQRECFGRKLGEIETKAKLELEKKQNEEKDLRAEHKELQNALDKMTNEKKTMEAKIKTTKEKIAKLMKDLNDEKTLAKSVLHNNLLMATEIQELERNHKKDIALIADLRAQAEDYMRHFTALDTVSKNPEIAGGAVSVPEPTPPPPTRAELRKKRKK